MAQVEEIFWPVPVEPSEHPDGARIEIIATLVHTKDQLDTRGFTVTKGLFLCERNEGRFKLWGTVPFVFSNDANDLALMDQTATLKGSLVKFSADVKRGDKDECFGVFRRPTKAELILPGRNGRER